MLGCSSVHEGEDGRGIGCRGHRTAVRILQRFSVASGTIRCHSGTSASFGCHRRCAGTCCPRAPTDSPRSLAEAQREVKKRKTQPRVDLNSPGHACTETCMHTSMHACSITSHHTNHHGHNLYNVTTILWRLVKRQSQ